MMEKLIKRGALSAVYDVLIILINFKIKSL